jgi:pyruvate dehydrogenase E1 component alpha subunit
MAVHTTADDPKRYRTEEEVQKWRERDPIVRYQKYLVDKGFLSEDKIADIEAEVLAEIQAAVDGAEEQMKALGDPIDMFEHAYARMPAYLKEQKETFATEVAEITEEENSG